MANKPTARGRPILVRQYGEDMTGLIPIEGERHRCVMRTQCSCRICYGKHDTCPHLIDHGLLMGACTDTFMVLCAAAR
jgi:hypothetical protein